LFNLIKKVFLDLWPLIPLYGESRTHARGCGAGTVSWPWRMAVAANPKLGMRGDR
jgi:hypothetical protein